MTRLAISNIAWDVAEDEAVARLLQRFAVDAIDVAPGKYFPQPSQASAADIEQVRQCWADRGIEITGMQSLLFGTQGLNVFGPPEVQQAMLDHLAAVCRIGAGLRAPRLVFGSPRNRDRGGLADEPAMDIAAAFFRRLGEVAAAEGVRVCLEPNPSRYGANFMIDSRETAAVVRRVAHPAIRMQFDTGAVTINGEQPDEVLRDCAALIGHVHASEPDLLPLGEGGTDHRAAAQALRRHQLDGLVSIEMLVAKPRLALAAIEPALAVAVAAYRDA